MIRLCDEIIVEKWLSTMGLQDYDISSNSSENITVTTNRGAMVVSVDINPTGHDHMTVTAVSSFSWKGTVVSLDSFNRILPHITVYKWGWFYESYSSVLLKTFPDYHNLGIVIKGYSIEKLQSPHFTRFVENCCSMQVSAELLADYTIRRSIMFSVPVTNPLLQDAMIRNKEDLFRCLKKD